MTPNNQYNSINSNSNNNSRLIIVSKGRLVSAKENINYITLQEGELKLTMQVSNNSLNKKEINKALNNIRSQNFRNSKSNANLNVNLKSKEKKYYNILLKEKNKNKIQLTNIETTTTKNNNLNNFIQTTGNNKNENKKIDKVKLTKLKITSLDTSNNEENKNSDNDDVNNDIIINQKIEQKNIPENKKIKSNNFDAENIEQAKSFLASEGYNVVSIKPVKKNFMTLDLILTSPIKTGEMAFALTQISTYLKAGISLIDAYRILAKQATNPTIKKIYDMVVYELLTGESLSEALAKQPKVFPKLLTNMVKSAELTGDLPVILDDMADYEATLLHMMNRKLQGYYDRRDALKRQLQLISPESRIRDRKMKAAAYSEQLQNCMDRIMSKYRHRLELDIERMKRLSPLDKLNSGYSYVANSAGKNVKHIADTTVDDDLSIYVSDGVINARVVSVTKEEDN